MGWRDLLQTKDERLVAPWVGGRFLRSKGRGWTIEGKLPREFGWYEFSLSNRRAEFMKPADPDFSNCLETIAGYLVGDRLVPDGASANNISMDRLVDIAESVLLIEPGLERFVRVSASRFAHCGPLIFKQREFPLGPEDELTAAFLHRQRDISSISNVTPASEAAFTFEWLHRVEVERVREEERKRREEEERRARIREQIGTGEGRRTLATIDFAEAARAALKVSGAEYLDHRPAHNRGEMVVQYKVGGRTLECVCDMYMHIIDAGICLTDHHTGEKGDTYFTLESLPAVVKQAITEHRLHVYRHVDDFDVEDEEW